MTTALVLPVLLVHQRCAPLMIRGESSSPCLRSLHTLPLVSRTYVFFLKVRASATGGRFRGTFTVRRSPLEGDARNHRCPPRFRGMLLSPMDWFHGPLLVVLQPGPCHVAVEQDRWAFRMCTSRQGIHAHNPRNPRTQLWILLLPFLLLR